MEKIILVQVETSAERQIHRLAENKKVQVMSVGTEVAGCTVREIVSRRGQDVSQVKISETGESLPKASLMIFSDVSEKHFDKILFDMRAKKINVDYKAVVTPTNQNWTIDRLYSELEKEKIFYLNRNR